MKDKSSKEGQFFFEDSEGKMKDKSSNEGRLRTLHYRLKIH
jgi:hypothetical protein